MDENKKIILNHIVVHKLFKKQNDRSVDEQISNSLLDINEQSLRFVNDFQQANTTKRGLQMGTFIEDEKVFPLQGFVRRYVDSQSPQSFLEMSKNIAFLLKNCLIDEPRSTGGFLIVFDYNVEGRGQIIAIALMSDKESIGLDSELQFVLNTRLDLDKMNLATTLIVERWSSQNSDLNYLTFISGLKDISNYYKDKFIGCSNVYRSFSITQLTMNSIESFLISKGFDEEKLRPIRDEIVKYVDQNPDEVKLSSIKNIAMTDTNMQDEFDDYVTNNGIELSASFKPNKAAIKKWRKFFFNKNGIKLDIDQSKIKDQTVSFDKERKVLIIKDTDDELLSEFSKFQ